MTDSTSGSSKRLAFIIGINYTGMSGALQGCINDAHRIRDILLTQNGYHQDDIYLMTDEASQDLIPTKSNILRVMDTIVERSLQDDVREIWISFSGHGSYTRDSSGDEWDKKDELFVPLDYRTAGFIRDDTWNTFLSRFPSQCCIFNLFDCCHSGSLGDLQYHYYYDRSKPRFVRKRIRVRVKRGRRYRWVWRRRRIRLPAEWRLQKRQEKTPNRISAHVITISGCKDPQTSADAYIQDIQSWAGALSHAFCDQLENAEDNLRCLEFCKDLNEAMLNTRMTQRPTISSNREITQDDILVMKKRPTGFILNDA